jgi:hypothetical protein
MVCFTLLFTRKDKGSAHDDKISVSQLEGSRSVYQVVYHSPELKYDRKFLASSSNVLAYVEDTLTSMRHDIEPFENIQLLTLIHPSVLYHVSDMDEYMVRNLILNMASDAMRYDATSVRE